MERFVFRYVNPGVEMSDREKPRIVKHKIENNTLKLWFSYPLNEQTVNAGSFMLNDITFQHFTLQEENCLLILTADKELPWNNIYLSVIDKPKSIDSENITL